MVLEFRTQDLRPLNPKNIDEVYGLYKRNEQFFLISKEDFERQTLKDEQFTPELSFVYYLPNSNDPIAVLVAVIKKSIILQNLTIKILLVDKKYRRQHLGTQLFKELIKRAKSLLNVTSFVNYGFCPPEFMQPGVDVRHTSLLFFLQSMGLKQRKPRKNLTVHIPSDFRKPKEIKNGFRLQRISEEYFEPTVAFVKKEFFAPTWSSEVELTFKSEIPTTFIAIDSQNSIVGFASHSTCFAGSFGPTGVAKTIRGKGIGSELLKWCIWDIQKLGLDTCTIMYVVGDTIKYYSKVVEAYIHPVYIPLSRNILHWWKIK